jgi:hypothetical protein
MMNVLFWMTLEMQQPGLCSGAGKTNPLAPTEAGGSRRFEKRVTGVAGWA